LPKHLLGAVDLLNLLVNFEVDGLATPGAILGTLLGAPLLEDALPAVIHTGSKLIHNLGDLVTLATLVHSLNLNLL
jgi:hypothetical protein